MQERGLFAQWVIVGPDGDLVGRANIQNIVRGTMQGGTLGYWVDRDHLRRGLARAAVDFLGEQALELGCTASRPAPWSRTSPRSGCWRHAATSSTALAPKLLFLNGAWRDHVLYQKLLHDEPLD